MDSIDPPPLSLSLSLSRSFCSRPPAGTPRAFETIETGAWLQGAGSFVLLSPPSSPTWSSSELQVQVAFRTLSPDGLLLQLFGEADMMQYLSLSLSGGRIVMEFVSSSLSTPSRLETVSAYSNGNWYFVTAELAGRNAFLTVNMTEMRSTEVNLVMNFNFTDQIYIGGLSPETQADIGRYVPRTLHVCSCWKVQMLANF